MPRPPGVQSYSRNEARHNPKVAAIGADETAKRARLFSHAVFRQSDGDMAYLGRDDKRRDNGFRSSGHHAHRIGIANSVQRMNEWRC